MGIDFELNVERETDEISRAKNMRNKWVFANLQNK